MEKEIRVSVTPRTILAVALIAGGAYLLWLLRDLTLLVLTAIVIASAIEPGIAFFMRRGLPRFLATLAMYLFVFGSVFALVYFFFPPIIADMVSAIAALPQFLSSLNVPESLRNLTNLSTIGGANVQHESFFQTLLALQGAFSAASGGVVQFVAAFFGGILSFVLVVVLSFYFALQDTGMDDFLRLVMPVAYEDYAVDLWRRSQKKIGLWMQGQILLSVIIGVLVYLGLLIIGVPYALLLAIFTALAEIIPIFGSLLSGAAAAFVGYTQGGLALAAIVVGLYIVVNQFESNLIYPLIVKKVVGVPPLLVIVALIAGYTIAGFLGVLLSVPMAAILLELLSDYYKRKRRRIARHSSAA